MDDEQTTLEEALAPDEGGEAPEETAEETAPASRRMPRGTGKGADEEKTTETGETLDDLFGRSASEEDRTEAPPEGEAEEAPEVEGEEPPEEVEGEEPEAVTVEDIDADFLPEGYTQDETGRIHKPDGSFASLEEVQGQIEEARAAADEFFGEDEEGEGEEPDEEAPEVEPLELELDEDERLEIEVDDPETREALEAKFEKAERVEEAEARVAEVEEQAADVEAREQALQGLEREMQADPVGFMLERMPEERQAQVAEALLYEDGVLEAVAEKIQTWQRNPGEREKDRLKFENERYKQRDELTAEEKRRQKGQQIVDRLQTYVPDGMGDDLAERFLADAAAEIKRHLQQNPVAPDQFDLDQIPEIIAPRLELYGIDPDTVTENGRPAETGITEAEPRDERGQELAEEAEHFRRTGEILRKARARKEKAAASTPPGAGSGPRGPDMGDKTLDEALGALERRAG